MARIEYCCEPHLGTEEFVDVLRRSTLDERRPVEDSQTIAGMLAHADLIVTARNPDGLLVGVSRAITDFSYCTYLSDLAVDVVFQRLGIGRELIRRTHLAAGLHTSLILLAAPKAEGYYPHIGMVRHNSCWRIERRSGNGGGGATGTTQSNEGTESTIRPGAPGSTERLRGGQG